LVKVYRRRTKTGLPSSFDRKLPINEADVVICGQDNLNTAQCFFIFENLPPAEAFALMKRFFEFHYMPKERQLVLIWR